MSSKNSNNTDYKKYRLLVERYMSRPLGVSAPHNLGAVSNFPSFEEKHGFGDENHHDDEDDMEMKHKPNMDRDDSSMEGDEDDDMENDNGNDMDKSDMDMSNDKEDNEENDDENKDGDEGEDEELDIDVTDDELNSEDGDNDEGDDMDDDDSEMSNGDGEEFGRKHSDMAFMRAVSEWKKNIAKDNESSEIEEKPKKKKKAKMKKDNCVCNETNKDWYESIVKNYTKMSEDKLASNSKKVPGPGEVGYAPETRIGWGSENQELQETVNALKKKISILEKKLSKKK